MERITSNLIARLRLLRIAIGRRFIYKDVVEMAREYGIEYRDVIANTEPFEFVAAVARDAPAGNLDFYELQRDEASFTIPGLPPEAISEPSVARFVGRLAFHLNAQTVVELGSFSGWTSAHIAFALKARANGGLLYCVDIHDEHLSALRANLDRYSLSSYVKVIKGSSLDGNVLARLPSAVDLVFLDTSHTYPATRDELLASIPRLSPSGCLVLHDSVSAVGVRRSLAEIPHKLRRFCFATEAGNGVTVLFRPTFFTQPLEERDE